MKALMILFLKTLIALRFKDKTGLFKANGPFKCLSPRNPFITSQVPIQVGHIRNEGARRGGHIITYKYYTENDPDGEKDDERPPPAEAGAAPVGERPHDGREEEADQGREAPDHRHVLVADS